MYLVVTATLPSQFPVVHPAVQKRAEIDEMSTEDGQKALPLSLCVFNVEHKWAFNLSSTKTTPP